ncbi:MAG: hypothetical protein WCT10_05150 [Patescibacteria group bacterium]|jgi:hypothetical protein
MAVLEQVRLKTGTMVPNVVCAAAMSTLRRIRAESPDTLVRIVRSGGNLNLGLIESDHAYLDYLGLLERHTNSLPEDFLQVLLSAVTLETGEPALNDPISK